jgi:hypothetical protein
MFQSIQPCPALPRLDVGFRAYAFVTYYDLLKRLQLALYNYLIYYLHYITIEIGGCGGSCNLTKSG